MKMFTRLMRVRKVERIFDLVIIKHIIPLPNTPGLSPSTEWRYVMINFR